MSASSPGFFLSLEGGEGSGKTTQARRLASWLEQEGVEVLLLREPGSTQVGEEIRTILFTRRPEHEAPAPVTETLLFHAARAQLVNCRIRPALDAGAVVITDRFADSTAAYQGYGLGLDVTQIQALNGWATGGLMPHLTLLFDLDPMERSSRAGGSTPTDPIEERTLAFHQRVRQGYLSLAQQFPQRIRVIDAHEGEDQVFAAARDVLRQALAVHGIQLAGPER